MFNKTEIVVLKSTYFIVMICAIGLMIFCIIGFIDSFTIKNTGIKYVKCVDDLGRDFADELCVKETRCSWLGVAADKKCVSEQKSEVKE